MRPAISRWSDDEQTLFEMLVEQDQTTAWEIGDLLDHHDINRSPSRGPTWLVPLTSEIIAYSNSQIAANPKVIPPGLTRPGKYPIVRQMRDVHQFDVGGHLAASYALSVRRAPIQFTESLGFDRVAAALTTDFQFCDFEELSAAALLHDIFKCLRPRRPLPSKQGSKASLSLTFPDGRPIAAEVSASGEAAMLTTLLPCFENFPAESANVIETVIGAERFGAGFYKLLASPSAELDEHANSLCTTLGPSKTELASLYLALCDVLAKGMAIYVVTTRKARLHSLIAVVTAFLGAAERRFSVGLNA
jgi:hypothetical protein